MEKKLDSNYKRTLRAILKKSRRQHTTKQQLYSHLLPITKTIKIRRTRHAGHCWRSKGRAHKRCTPTDPFTWPRKGRTTSSNLQLQFCVDTGCSPEDLPEAIDDREGCRERERESRISVLIARHGDYDDSSPCSLIQVHWKTIFIKYFFLVMFIL